MLEQEFQPFKEALRARARKLGLTDAERSRLLRCRDLAPLERAASDVLRQMQSGA